jgi:hypothetical protein
MKRLLAFALILSACKNPYTVPKKCIEDCKPYTVESWTYYNDLTENGVYCRCDKTNRICPTESK